MMGHIIPVGEPPATAGLCIGQGSDVVNDRFQEDHVLGSPHAPLSHDGDGRVGSRQKHNDLSIRTQGGGGSLQSSRAAIDNWEPLISISIQKVGVGQIY